MIQLLTSLWKYGGLYCGIEACTTDGILRYYVVTAKLHRGEFSDLEFFEAEDWNEVVMKTGKYQHAYLTINTEKVLIKQVEAEKDMQKIHSNAFPGLSPQEFYFDTIVSENTNFVAVCRKDDVEGFIKQAESNKFSILGIRLGFAALDNIVKLFDLDALALSRQTIKLKDGHIMAFSNQTQKISNYTIEGIQCPSTHLLALSTLMGYVSETPSTTSTKEQNQLLANNYFEKNFFRKGLVMGAICILIIVLINMFFYTSYRHTYRELLESNERALLQREILSKKVAEVAQKEKVAIGIISSESSESSFFINRVVASIPPSIIFDEIIYQPLDKPLRPDKAIEIQKDKILLSGETLDKEAFSLWIKSLETQLWTERVIVTDYSNQSSKKDRFKLQLALNHGTAE